MLPHRFRMAAVSLDGSDPDTVEVAWGGVGGDGVGWRWMGELRDTMVGEKLKLGRLAIASEEDTYLLSLISRLMSPY